MLIDLYAGTDAESKGYNFYVLPAYAHLFTGGDIIFYDGLATFDGNPAGGGLFESWAKAGKRIKYLMDGNGGGA